jgi:Mrp family chromosome partitioning ATPase
VLPVTDAAALAPKVDGCLLVVDSGRTQARSAQRAIDALRAVHAVIFGAVLNKVALPQTSYYYPQAEAELVGAATPE